MAQADHSFGETSACGVPIVALFPASNLKGTLAAGDCVDQSGSYVDVYKFQASAENDIYAIEARSDAFVPVVRVYDAQGTLVGSGVNHDGATRFQRHNLLGTYYVFVGASNPGIAGNYQVKLSLFFVDIFPDPRIDFDGRFGVDPSVYRPSDNKWLIRLSGDVVASFTWGEAGDRMVPADYDGDGKTDVAMFRPSTGIWYIIESQTGTFRTVSWGQNGDIPLTREGEQRNADLIVFRPSEGRWYIRQGPNDTMFTVNWGQAGDIPIYEQFTFGSVPFTVFRPSEGRWYFLQGSNMWTVDWGQQEDIPVPADYDNDGRADIAVYRPSTGQWFLIKSRYGDTQVMTWGQPGDIPVPDDYYGDGRTDLAVFRPSDARWHLYSFDRVVSFGSSFQFGEPGDLPVLTHHYLR